MTQSLRPSEVNVDHTVQLAADQFEIAVNGSDGFVNRDLRGSVSIDSGFLVDPYLAEDVASAIAGAVTDEAELHVLPNKMVSVLRGRSLASYAADGSVYREFVTTLPGVPGQPAPTPVTQQILGLPLRTYGAFRASEIARTLCADVGLSLSWNVADYTLRENFSATGSALSAIQTLVSHVSHYEPSKVDIWEEGGALIVRNRSIGVGLEVNVQDARITDLMARARFLGYVGTVRVIGNVIKPSALIVIGPTDDTSTDTDDITAADGTETSITTTTVTRGVDSAVLSRLVETWVTNPDGSTSNTTESMTSVWEEPTISMVRENFGQIINKPKELSRSIEITSSSSDEGVGPSSLTTITMAYDENGYLRSEVTETSAYDPSANSGQGDYTSSSLETKTYRRNGANQYEITTTTVNSGGAGEVRRTKANGTPPGGPGRPSAPGQLPTIPIVQSAFIGGGPGAKDLTISSDTVYYDQYLFGIIVAQARQASGATEVEVNFTAANMPWLRQGQNLRLTNLQDEVGYDIPFADALVTEVKFEYREDSEEPRSVSHVKCVYWA